MFTVTVELIDLMHNDVWLVIDFELSRTCTFYTALIHHLFPVPVAALTAISVSTDNKLVALVSTAWFFYGAHSFILKLTVQNTRNVILCSHYATVGQTV